MRWHLLQKEVIPKTYHFGKLSYFNYIVCLNPSLVLGRTKVVKFLVLLCRKVKNDCSAFGLLHLFMCIADCLSPRSWNGVFLR